MDIHREGTMRYVVAEMPGGLWGHMVEAKQEIFVRLVYDREEAKLLFAEEMGTRNIASASDGWQPVSPELLAEIEDSLKNANGDALVNPEYWGLTEADQIPSWADGHVAAVIRL